MMRRILSAVASLLAAISLSAQETVEFRFGCIDYDEVFLSMPEYAQAEAELAELREKYDAETKASEDEFNAKYELFLEEQGTYAPSILRKRQSELEDMMQRNERFRVESIRLLGQAREDLLKPVRDKLNAAINEVAREYDLAFVLNTSSDAVPYLNVNMAYNVTVAVQRRVEGN